ncbi:MAG: O-antigen ligase family protein [Candidatus Scalindua sediminis]|nr:O-antigen ligase family protein [Candidatus Scalindua sediminis]
MGIIFWICTISVVCIITGVTFYKPYLGIAFVIVSIPFEGSKMFDGISIYPLETILVLLVGVCIYKLISGREIFFRNRKLVFYYLPFMLCILLSSLKFMELSLTIKEIVRWLELIVVYFLTINLINDYKKVRVILYSMILTTAMVSMHGVVSYLAGVESVYDGRPGAYSFFGHPNGLAGYVNLIIPVLFGMLMTSVFLWERIALGAFTVLSIMSWFLAFSRSAWISLILAMIIIFFLTKVKKRVAILLAMLFVIFAITFLSSNITDDFQDRLGLQEVEGRAMFYPIGFNMVKDDLIFGIGVGNYPLLIKKFTNMRFLVQNDLHCLYLQMFVEAGLMGLCAFVFWLACISKYLMSALKSLEKSRDYGLFVGLVGGVIVYLFNNLANVLTVHGIHLQWGIILGLAVVLIQFRESETCLKAV